MVCLFQSFFLLNSPQSWMEGNGIFWSPDTRQASQATISSHGTPSFHFCQYLKVLSWKWACGPWTQEVRRIPLISRHLRKNLCEVCIHLYSTQPLLLWSDLPQNPEPWIKMNVTARAEHPCALHPVGDLLHHLLHHLPRPLPLLRHRVLHNLLLLFWQERSKWSPLRKLFLFLLISQLILSPSFTL